MIAAIVNGKPIPSMKRKGAPPKYPWLHLKPGQAFRFSDDVTFGGARSMASMHRGGATAKWKFVVRQCDDGIWCWRVDGTPYELQNGNVAENVAVIEYDPKEHKGQRTAAVEDMPTGMELHTPDEDVM